MDPTDPYTHPPAPLFKWDPRPPPPPPPPLHPSTPRDLADVFNGYGIRYLTVIHIGELGFTPSTLLGMRDEELDDMMTTLSHLFRWELLVGERYGIKAAIRAERRRLDPASLDDGRRRFSDVPLDAISQEGLSEERVHHDSGGEVITDKGKRSVTCKKKSNKKDKFRKKLKKKATEGEGEQETDSDSDSDGSGVGYGMERQREHPFIVTEPGEVARAKKNGLDYLFHLYEQCREFLVQVQAMAKEQGDKCPTKVTNQVFRYAKKVGASYINKPKMRHYVHCYALHCLDEETSNALRREYKQRGENVGAWRLACYQPIVVISAQHNWDVDAVFNAHPRLSIWYVPTKLRQLCHLARSHAAGVNVVGGSNSVSSMF